jgi:hypothetical protein
LRTRRPALVAIRARKPCVRARFSLLGAGTSDPPVKGPARVRSPSGSVNRRCRTVMEPKLPASDYHELADASFRV